VVGAVSDGGEEEIAGGGGEPLLIRTRNTQRIDPFFVFIDV